MPKRYRPREIIRVLESLGWVWVRTRGDHARLVKPDGSFPTTVPLYRNEIDTKLFKLIRQQCSLTRQEFDEAAEEVL